MKDTRIVAEIQTLLQNAHYLGDGQVIVLTQDIENVQEALSQAAITPNEPKSLREYEVNR